MPYVTSWERIGIEKGRQEGLRQAIELVLHAKFGTEGNVLQEQIQRLADEQPLVRFLTAAMNPASTLDSLRRLLQAAPV